MVQDVRVYPLKGQNHDRLEAHGVTSGDFSHQPPSLAEVGCEVLNQPVIDVPVQAMPDEAGFEALQRVDIVRAGAAI